MTRKIRAAVVGAGVQGERHAQKFAALDGSELIGVVDLDIDRAKKVAGELNARAFADYRELIGKVDAVALASPTSTHFEIASTLLKDGVHLLIEKPIATTAEEGWELVRLADERGLILQVGHQERYNPAVLAIADRVREPLFIESNRIAPYRPRALDVSVVLDLMIHDIDLIHSFVQSPMASVDAVGRRVFSESIDVANARIRFENGCIANVTSSRVSMKTERSLRVFQPDEYISADLHNKTVTRYARKGEGPVTGPEDVLIDKAEFGESDAMMVQTEAFLDSINGGPAPLVSGRTGTEALATAAAISQAVGNLETE
jgi:predicted dehydrogenase